MLMRVRGTTQFPLKPSRGAGVPLQAPWDCKNLFAKHELIHGLQKVRDDAMCDDDIDQAYQVQGLLNQIKTDG